jgi:RNA polymerase sigma-B factor
MRETLLHRNTSSLSQGELNELFVSWRTDRNPIARERLVEHYLPLAYKLARRYRGAHEPVGDLRQVAALGLLKAINGFEPERGFKFASYAVPSILGELRRYFRDCGWSVHMPRGIQELALKVEQARRELDAEHTVVTATLIAEYLELTTEQVSDALEANAAHHAISLDTPVDDGDSGSTTIGSTIGTIDPGFHKSEMRADVAKAAMVLSDRDRLVLMMRFEGDLTQSEIGAELGVSQMQVSRILKRALTRLESEISSTA